MPTIRSLAFSQELDSRPGTIRIKTEIPIEGSKYEGPKFNSSKWGRGEERRTTIGPLFRRV